MGSGFLIKLIRNTLVVLLIAIGIGYAALYYIYDGEKALPAKPTTQIYVQDQGKLLSTEEQAKLEISCEKLYNDTGIKLVFLTINSLPVSYNLEEYASGVYTKWELNKNPNQGLLFVYNKDDGKAVLETLSGSSNYTSNFNSQFIVSNVEGAVLNGKAHQGFNSMVDYISNYKNGTSPIIPEYNEDTQINITNDSNDSFIPKSMNRATIINFIFQFIIFLFVIKKIFSKAKRPVKINLSKGNNFKHKNNVPVAYRRSYDEEYGDKDHIYS